MSRSTKILACAGLTSSAVDSAITEDNAVLKAIVGNAKAELLGSTPQGKVEVAQWLSFSLGELDKEKIGALNAILLLKSYLVGNSVTLADFSVFVALSDTKNLIDYANVNRWYNHIRSLSASVDGITTVNVSSASLTYFPLPVMDDDASAVAASASATPTAAAPTAGAAAPATASNKKEKTPAQAASSSSAKADTPAAVTIAAAEGLDPSKLDIRCGVVLKCWNHPDSEKLLCEEVDLGGGDVRQIASGIRAFYSAEQLAGRQVCVLANLKERSIGGFKSQVRVVSW